MKRASSRCRTKRTIFDRTISDFRFPFSLFPSFLPTAHPFLSGPFSPSFPCSRFFSSSAVCESVVTHGAFNRVASRTSSETLFPSRFVCYSGQEPSSISGEKKTRRGRGREGRGGEGGGGVGWTLTREGKIRRKKDGITSGGVAYLISRSFAFEWTGSDIQA